MTSGRRRALLWAARIGAFLIAAAFIAIGIIGSQHTDVFQKAVRICLECIGIG